MWLQKINCKWANSHFEIKIIKNLLKQLYLKIGVLANVDFQTLTNGIRLS